MEIFLNGKKREISEKIISVEDLSNLFLKSEKGVIIEVNGKLIRKEQRAVVKLKDGDKVELIQFMGGG